MNKLVGNVRCLTLKRIVGRGVDIIGECEFEGVTVFEECRLVEFRKETSRPCCRRKSSTSNNNGPDVCHKRRGLGG